MILQKGDKRREKFLKGGSVLKKMRDAGGWSKGAIAGGVVLLVFAVLLALPCLLADLGMAALSTFGCFGFPGILLILAGNASQKKKLRDYLSYYEKETGFSREELQQVEQEVMEPDMVMIGNVPDSNRQGASEKNPHISCMITKHYFVAPLIMGKSYIRRISDMVLAAYSMEIPGINGSTDGLIFLSKKDTEPYKNATLTRNSCEEIIGILRAKQPDLITTQRFEYNGRKYDVITDGMEVARVLSTSTVLRK